MAANKQFDLDNAESLDLDGLEANGDHRGLRAILAQALAENREFKTAQRSATATDFLTAKGVSNPDKFTKIMLRDGVNVSDDAAREAWFTENQDIYNFGIQAAGATGDQAVTPTGEQAPSTPAVAEAAAQAALHNAGTQQVTSSQNKTAEKLSGVKFNGSLADLAKQINESGWNQA